MKVAVLNFLVITLLMPVMLYGAEHNSSAAPNNAAAQGKVSTIVIDAGHGGVDPGTNFGKVLEKDITLNIAKELGALITKNLPGVKVVYTRTTDVYVTLDERSNIANRAKADLFLSIHINGVDKKPEVNGTSTFVMGNDKSGANLNVAMKENSVMQYEPNFAATYEGFDPKDPASYIIFNLQQFANQDQSMILAETIQKHYAKELPLRDRGAYHETFLVLWRTTMPSVLTEIGFMTNKGDREYISTAKGQRAAARALFNAFSEYKSRIEGRSTMVQLKSETTSEPALPDPVAIDDKPVQTSGQTAPQQQQQQQQQPAKTEHSATGAKARTTLPDISAYFPADGDKKSANTAGTQKTDAGAQGQPKQSTAQAGSKSVTQPSAPTSQGQRPAGTPAATKPSGSTVSGAAQQTQQTTRPATAQQPVASRSRILYYVQIAALDKPHSVNSADFKSYRGKVVEKRLSGRYPYKYLVGGVSTYEEIRVILNRVRSEFPDAFLTAFDGEEQITAAEARERQKR